MASESGYGLNPDELVVVQYWDAEEVPDYIAAEVATFADMNPGFRHLVFSEGEAEVFIVEHFGERELAAFRACGVPAMQSDYFRLCAGLVLGGVYADVDFHCVAPLASLRAILRAYWDVIGDYERVTAALQGVDIQPPDAHLDFVRPSVGLAYKNTEAHWLNFKGDIFTAR